MKCYQKKVFAHGVILVCAFLFSHLTASAASIEKMNGVPVSGGFVVGPGAFSIEGNPGDFFTRTIQITNEKGRTDGIRLLTEDFQGSANPEQALELQGENASRYGAKDWIVPEVTQMECAHGERMHIDVTIKIPNNADAGDHYAALLVTDDPEKNEQTKIESQKQESNVLISTRVGVLFYIKVNGNVKEEGSLESFSANKTWYEELPVDFSLQFRNTGTVRLETSGTIEIKNIFNKTVKTLQLEKSSTFRDSVRRRDVKWEGDDFLLGPHTATLALNRGYGDIVDTKEVSFWMIPWREISKSLAIGAIVIAILVFLKKMISIDIKVGKKKR